MFYIYIIKSKYMLKAIFIYTINKDYGQINIQKH